MDFKNNDNNKEDPHNLMDQSFGCLKSKEDSSVNDQVQNYTLPVKVTE